ncbi:MAG: hypothetical protein ABH889_02835 [Candidatus Portnoybacteria bacterium]
MPNREIYLILQYFVSAVANWWWLILPFIFLKPLLFLYRWWRVESWLSKQKIVLLEIRLPRDITKPIRAMEGVLSSIASATFQPPDFWEQWIDGQVQLSISLEIASINGTPHFYIRTPASYKDAIESSFYAQYPEIEINEVDDYTKYVPQNIPNKEWNMFAGDYVLIKDDHLPIKTYIEFETEMEKEEEKRVDPMAALLEAMAKIKEGEQLWIQIIIEPFSDADAIKMLWGITTKPGSFGVWRKKGEELRDKIARRPEANAATKPMIQEAAQILITGKISEEEISQEKDIIPPEMKLTPGEREVLAAIEHKMSKVCYSTSIRFIYLGKRDVWFKPNFRLAFSFFNQYSTNNRNSLFVMGSGATLTKIAKSVFFPPLNWGFIKNRRAYLRCRRQFRNYIRRFTPYFPRSPRGTYVMNVEELASLFHLPGKGAAPAPGLIRLEAKKGGGSSNLPSE